MRFSKSKWLACTLFVGLIPVLTRLVAWLIANAGVISPCSAPDFIVFGLVLHVSIINEIEHLPAQDKEWKTLQNGASFVFFSIYSTLYALTLIAERNAALINATAMLGSCITFASISLLLASLVFRRLSQRRMK
ncbi:MULTISPECIES: hypothetical protein [unclassified Duganella]|uniref:hypothetical protein n=1 Tax=unclassified Duganella TaxID=2636909 RepID=UPI001029A1AF|nr:MULTISPECIES: hypothetical protein [unclassified Duganella]